MHNTEEKIIGNKLIFFLSTCKPTAKINKYSYEKVDEVKKNREERNYIEGIQTPDAPSKYFLTCIGDKNIDEIICITSKDANENTYKFINGDITLKSKYKYREEEKICIASAYEEYEKMVEDFCREERIKKPIITKLSFDFDFEINDEIVNSQRNKKLCENIANRVYKGDTIYIDYTSGMRDTSLLIILIIKYLEYKGVNFGGMIYSLYDNKNGCKIVDLESTYGLFELIKGVNEFTSFGKSKTLSNYYESIDKIENIEHKDKIKNLIDTINEFSEMINLCMLDKIDTIMENLNNSISEIKSIDKKDNNELVNYMLFNLIEEIEQKFYLDEEDKKITYLKLVKWCLDNELIQQALTLYVEKMPTEFFNLKLLDKSKMENMDNEEYDKIFYTDLFSVDKYEANEASVINFKYIKDIIDLNREQIYRGDSRYLKKYSKNSNTKKILLEINRIISNIDLYESLKVCGSKKLSELCNNIPKSKEKFINSLGTQKRLIEYIIEEVTGCKMENTKINLINRDQVYDKKLRVIEQIKQINKKPNWCNISIFDLSVLMQDYLLFKIFRNQINHAKESNLSDYIKEFFNSNGYNTEITVYNIKTMMLKAVDNIERISDNIKIDIKR